MRPDLVVWLSDAATLIHSIPSTVVEKGERESEIQRDGYEAAEKRSRISLQG